MNVVNEQTACEVARTVKGGVVVGPSTVRRSPSIGALATAMNRVQAEIEDPAKNKKVDAGRRAYRYADLPGVLDVVRPELAKHGLAVVQCPCELDGEAALTTVLAHGASGEWLETTIRLRPVQGDPQSVGSALTYARRYALLSLFGIAADDDDDGKAASQPARSQQQQQPEAADNHPLRARYAMRLGQCKSRDEYLAICAEVAADVKGGRLTEADRLALAPVAKETSGRFPEPSRA